jgi:hypothetical protein
MPDGYLKRDATVQSEENREEQADGATARESGGE